MIACSISDGFILLIGVIFGAFFTLFMYHLQWKARQ